MGFYEQISRYYDVIFPVGGAQLGFLRKSGAVPGNRVLDVACGSGGYSVALAQEGCRVTAVDLDTEMVRQAAAKAGKAGVPLQVLQSDMKELEKRLQPAYDCIFCIGNSLVHLGSLQEITGALEQMNRLLHDKGSLVLQIINYDRILRDKIGELPTVEDAETGLQFIRRYVLEPDGKSLDFNTMLRVREGTEQIELQNSVRLLPLIRHDLEQALKNAGFAQIQWYGDFKETPYTEDAFMLVVRAGKAIDY